MGLFKRRGPHAQEKLSDKKSKVNDCFLLALSNLCQKINL